MADQATITAIVPMTHLHRGPGSISGPRTFTIEDTSKTIYPKRANGQTCRVVIIRRSLISSHGAEFKICRNAGKWSYKVKPAMSKTYNTKTRREFVEALENAGASHYTNALFAS